MRRQLRRRFWAEVGMGAISAFLLVLTLGWRNWIELVFRLDPDQNSGSLEWLVVISAAAFTAIFVGAARREWRTSASRT
jgi:hypothetical protein